MPHGQRFQLVLPNGRAMVETALVGRYNVSNLLAIAAVLYDAGLKPTTWRVACPNLTPPPGRMERVGGNGGEPLVVVDYAHTPDALENALPPARRWRGPKWPSGGRLRLRRRSRQGQAAGDGRASVAPTASW